VLTDVGSDTLRREGDGAEDEVGDQRGFRLTELF
jgi:hypothetical protein